MKEETSHKTNTTYFYEQQYQATSRLHCIPKRLCHTAQEVDAFVRHHHQPTSLVARHGDGSVLHTGTHEQMCLWVVKQSRPVWVEPSLLSSCAYQELCGLRLVFTPDNTPVLYRRTLHTQHTDTDTPPSMLSLLSLSCPYSTQSVVVPTGDADCTHHEAQQFLNRNRERLPASGYIDMCSIDKDRSCYYITDVQETDRYSVLTGK